MSLDNPEALKTCDESTQRHQTQSRARVTTIGARVALGDSDSADTGTVQSVLGDTVTVSWDTIPFVSQVHYTSLRPLADRSAALIARESLASGNVWAWGVAMVAASYDGEHGSDVLGACSYESEAELRACEYFSEMVDTALEELARKLLRRGVTAESI